MLSVCVRSGLYKSGSSKAGTSWPTSAESSSVGSENKPEYKNTAKPRKPASGNRKMAVRILLVLLTVHLHDEPSASNVFARVSARDNAYRSLTAAHQAP